MFTKIPYILCLLAAALLFSACGPSEPTPTGAPPDGQPPASSTLTPPAPSPTPTETPTPSPTPEPLAASVNGEPLTLAALQAEVARYQAGRQQAGTNIAPNLTVSETQYVLGTLMDQMLLAQGAAQDGFVLDEAALDARIASLAAAADLNDWMQRFGYSPAEFRLALQREAAAAWMRDQLGAAAATTADQVHVRQILLYNSSQANEILAQLKSGEKFLTLAERYDPLTGGDLGWFPRGYLVESGLEEAAFSLEPGNYSAVIQTRLGYHIVQLIERDPQRPLTPSARWVLQQQAIVDWLAEQRSRSTLEVLIQPATP